MQNKLQELTDKLYQEGLSKGKEDGAKLLSEAQAQADEIIAKAKAQAQSIVEQAEKQAQDLKTKAASDIRMASSQALQATKKDIEDLLLCSTVNKGVEKQLSDTALLKDIILSVAKNFTASESVDIALVLPEKVKAEVEPWLKDEFKKALGKEVKAEFSKNISGGFTIGPSDGSYFVSLSEQTFEALICEYLRPVTKNFFSVNNYEYIIASLPVLSSDFRGELDSEDILEQIREQLDGKDVSYFELLLDAFKADKLNEEFYRKALKCRNQFIRGYLLYDLCVRNLKVEYLNRQLGREQKQDVLDILGEEFEFKDTEKVNEALCQTDILGRERALDDLMWDEIERLCGLQVFSADVIFAFTAKLQIVSRWLRLDPESGRELFKKLVEEIRNNKKPIQ